MNPVLFLRIASVLTFVHAVLHTIGAVFGMPGSGAEEATLLVMKSTQFPSMGVMRSYWDFYLGFSLFVSVALLAESVVFWQLGSLAKSEAARLRPLMVTFLLGYLAFAVIAGTYFFAAPAVVEVLIASCMGLAIWSSR